MKITYIVKRTGVFYYYDFIVGKNYWLLDPFPEQQRSDSISAKTDA